MGVVYIVRTRVEPAHDLEWRRWQDEEHVSNLVTLPGYRGVQRFLDADRPHTYLNIWRLDDRSAQSSERYRIASLTPWFERIRPHYDVSVDFSVEADERLARGSAGWRDAVTSLLIDRGADGQAADDILDSSYEARLAATSGVVQVLRLDRLYEGDALSPRSAPSAVLLTYLGTTGAGAVPSAPPGVERRHYRAMSDYLAAPDRAQD